jgi:uncharacterized protein YabE (DUF348 family)
MNSSARTNPNPNNFSRLGLVLVGLAALVLVMVAITLLSSLSGQPVTLIIEGVRTELRTQDATVAALIQQRNILLDPEDKISPAPETAIENGLVVTIDKAQVVALIVSDDPVSLQKPRRLRTHLSQPVAMLTEAGLTVGKYDKVYVNGLPIAAEAYNTPYAEAIRSLRVVRAISFSVQEGDAPAQAYFTTATTVGEALASLPMAVRPSLRLADAIEPPLHVPLTDGATIKIMRAVPIRIEADGVVLQSLASAGTVNRALALAGVALVGLDYAIPPEDAPVAADMLIRVVRVTEQDEIAQTPIDYERRYQASLSLPPNSERLLQAGQFGILETRIQVRYENGIAVSRGASRTVLVQAPQPEIIEVGATPELVPGFAPTSTPAP